MVSAAALNRTVLVERIESYFKRVRKLGGDCGECSAGGLADWLMWFDKNAAPQVPEVREAPGNPIVSSPADAAPTPRTDGMVREVVDAMAGGGPQWDYVVPADFARQLERELDEWQDRMDACCESHREDRYYE